MSGEPKRSSTVASRVLAERDERVRERRPAVAFAPVQHEDRILDHDAGRNLDERAAGEERVVQHRERVLGRRATTRADDLGTSVVVAGRDAADAHALGLERGIELVVHDAAVAHDDHAGVRAGLRRPRPAAGRALVAGRAELVLGERAVPVEVELADPAVAPDLLARRRPGDRRRAVSAAASAPLRRASRARRAPAPHRP